MADNELKPLNDGDITPPPATTEFQPAAPLKDQGVDFAAESTASETGSGRTADAKQAIRDGAGKVTQQAGERIRAFADDGKARAGSALDQLSQMLTDAAAQVDEKLGGQYGDYARSAAGQVQGFSDTIRNKDVDELLEDARQLVKASPAVAVGVAAALGFVVARLVQSGLENRD
ncbi:hypothetical protein GCM10011380_24880 [Sphingomonas metalli]|uniref:CsbD family protein n=1 Tax=Sphingomonas metalli TaxID=1779358 RepID=A0A916WVR8_9SPHN|nr:hypothetical protein [Sphingomonas metalli]GGB34444.1 hypothetical protein GCM10011380_24880 [Sphingomonas metalli]